MKRKAIVTGAYGAIGQAIAKGIAEFGLDVTLVGRDEGKLKKAVADIQKLLPKAILEYKVVDLSSQEEIRELSEKWQGPLHVLVNNAGTTPRARTETVEGIEMQWATNVMGYYWMINYFSPHMREQEDARIVNVASYWAGDLNFDDLEFKTQYYNNDKAYRQSKQADRMLTEAFAHYLKGDHICVNACHPGDVNSKLSNDLGYGGSDTPEQGADTPVWLATSFEQEGETGHYYEHREKRRCHFMSETKAVDRLFAICKDY